MSVSHSEDAEPAGSSDLDWEALRWRELEWGALPHITRKGTIPYLTVREAGRLDSAGRTVRPGRTWSSPTRAWSRLASMAMYTCTRDVDGSAEHVALRWVMKRGINLRDFEIELEDPWYDSTVRGQDQC